MNRFRGGKYRWGQTGIGTPARAWIWLRPIMLVPSTFPRGHGCYMPAVPLKTRQGVERRREMAEPANNHTAHFMQRFMAWPASMYEAPPEAMLIVLLMYLTRPGGVFDLFGGGR